MSVGTARHMFPGGNTHLGFFSYYSHIISQEEAEKIFVIKGGPGVGKSTFMKKIGNWMLEHGYDVEFMHCSSDNNSLDGIVIPALKTAFIDGTSPHVVDPKNPGAVDEILNFGDFWDERGMKKHKAEIIRAGKEIGRLFGRAYKYIRAAYCIYEDSADIYDRALLKGRLNSLESSLEEELFSGTADAEDAGKQRCLFASAITPDGYCNFLDTLLSAGRIYRVKGGMGTGEEKLLDKIKETALKKGLDVECYYCALNPRKLEHLIIRGLDAAFTTSNSYHQSSVSGNFVIDMTDYMDSDISSKHADELSQNEARFDGLMDVAFECISRAKAEHDRLERYYVPNIDFEAIDCLLNTILLRVAGRTSMEEKIPDTVSV